MPYSKHGEPFAAGSDTSYEAALRASSFVSVQGLTVYRWIKGRHAYGGTQREAEGALQIARPSLCARFKALENTGAIRKTDRKRDGCQVYEVTGGTPAEQMRLLGD